MHSFYEFFAGGGMARCGLSSSWNCLFSNDFDRKKSETYVKNWGDDVHKTADVKSLMTPDLPGDPDLAWASFPCQDLSLAGGGAGLKGKRSGTFWPFWNLMKSLKEESRNPALIVLENVCGTLTSHGGADFSAICQAFNTLDYRFGAIVIDAAMFVPQSRPRLFVIGVRDDFEIPENLQSDEQSVIWNNKRLGEAQSKLSDGVRKKWVWWNLKSPSLRNICFSDLIEDAVSDVKWHTQEQTQKMLDMMSDLNLAKVEKAKQSGRKMVGTIYKRTRKDQSGRKMQRAEVRFDDIAGCLRTPAGGSSRQVIVVVDGQSVKSRLISSRETARLMGLPDDYILPEKYNEAYHLTGDGVVVPVVRHIAEYILEPILSKNKVLRAVA
ncbi:DNA cytosine methyltransferase [Paremcibacter congregatus]|uniref:DNA cytosine methyltransferase n=1 Tax=Paremcibacter congregatus TaxID=2043170 RepID=UPI003A8ED77C